MQNSKILRDILKGSLGSTSAKLRCAKRIKRWPKGILLLSLIYIANNNLVDNCYADQSAEIKAHLSLDGEKKSILNSSVDFKVEPSSLRDGSVITLITPTKWTAIGETLLESLKLTHVEFTQQLGELVPINTSLRILPEDLFYKTTGAPSWTNALFFRSQVFIPLSEKSVEDKGNLIRSARHEYVHSILHGLSAGRCPGWLDEGMAQWAEGEENPALRPALVKYLKNNPALPFSSLQGGFTRLPTNSVAAAYAQSLIATLALKKAFGFSGLRTYLDNLRVGEDRFDAFKNAFGVSEAHFEELMNEKLLEWALELR